GLVCTYTIRTKMSTMHSKHYYVQVLGGPDRRFQPWFDNAAKRRGIPDQDFRVRFLYQPLLDHIKRRTVTSNEVKQFMVERLTQRGLQGRRKLQRGWSSKPTYGPAWTGVSEMSHLGLLVNAGRKGSESLWMSSADYLATGRSVPDPEECMVELVGKYIECYGPVRRAAIAY